ncbi:hypothetical protein MBLNU459_g5343t2 [Dothideomycetes sp. NU459]
MESSQPTTYTMIPAGILLGVLASSACALNFPPLVWHIRNRNAAPACLVGWVLLNNLLSVINLAIWPTDDMANWFSGRGLCDIEAKIMVARSTALPAATLCIIRSLAEVINTEKTMLVPTPAQRRRACVLDLVWCLGVPVVTMFLHYIVQPNRYFIFGVSGCNPSVSVNWVTLVILSLPPLLLSVANAWYGALTIFRLRKYRHSFHTVLASANSTKSRFLRLFAIALLLTLALVPVQVYVLVRDLPSRADASAAYSWTQIHSLAAWQTVVLMPSAVLFDRWLDVAIGLALFVLFGCGRDAVAMYRDWAAAVGLASVVSCHWRRRGAGASGSSSSSSSSSSLGSRARLFVRGKVSSLSSLSSLSSSPPTPHDPLPRHARPSEPARKALFSGTSDPAGGSHGRPSMLARLVAAATALRPRSRGTARGDASEHAHDTCGNGSEEDHIVMAEMRGTVSSADAWSEHRSEGDGASARTATQAPGVIVLTEDVRGVFESA